MCTFPTWVILRLACRGCCVLHLVAPGDKHTAHYILFNQEAQSEYLLDLFVSLVVRARMPGNVYHTTAM